MLGGGIIRAIFALILGTATWMAVTWEQNPFREDWLPFTVPVETAHLPNGLVQVGKPGDLRVRVRASQEAWGQIKPDEFKASVDLSKQGPGIHSLDPKVESSGDYQVVDWEPKRVTVRLEPLAQSTVPVQLRMTGKLADGYILRSQTITPDQVTVTGEQDLVQTVTQVAISLNLDGINGNVTQDIAPMPVDSNGNPVNGLQFSPGTVRVSLEIDRQIGVKTVPIRVETKGQVAPGYWLSSVSVDPQTATITGGPAALSAVEYIDLPPLDLTGAKADIRRTNTLTAGSGYSITSATDVQVTAVIQPLRTTEVLPIGIAAQGVPAGLEAQMSSPTVEVTISGLVPALSALKPGDISAVVNVGGLAPGQYVLPVRLNAPAAVSLDSANPATVSVTLAPPATPTATPPSPSPSAAPSASAAASPSESPGRSPSPSPSTSPSPSGSPAASAR
ncbi:MAG TPA: CdaR family protein [Chloroflexota bacterium]|nr:CdaR family protein [Chloroflexota bacterium]